VNKKLNTKSNKKSMGIYSLESRGCGCEIRRYTGGKVITIGCKDHSNNDEYVCPICGKRQTMKQLKECRWSHAI